jgi:hypothetical protein
MTLSPTFVDFSADPARTANAAIRAENAGHAGDHWVLDAGGTVWVDVAADTESSEVTLKIRALVSKLGPESGYAPLDVAVNGHPLVSRFRIPGGGDLPQVMTFAVPGEWLTDGTNTLQLRGADDARTMLWLYRVLMESVWDRDAAERALLADTAKGFTFTTSTRPAGDGDWRPGPELRLWIDRGQAAPPAELTWRGRDGGEGTVAFAQEMTGLLGHTRTADGEWLQLSGNLVERHESPDGRVWRFSTETGWGGAWHRAGELAVHLDTGHGPVERLGWRDQRDTYASIGLSRDGASFTGVVRNTGEGPIGYRGTAVVPAPPTSGLSDDLDQAARAVQRLAGSAIDRFNTWLGDRTPRQ